MFAKSQKPAELLSYTENSKTIYLSSFMTTEDALQAIDISELNFLAKIILLACVRYLTNQHIVAKKVQIVRPEKPVTLAEVDELRMDQ